MNDIGITTSGSIKEEVVCGVLVGRLQVWGVGAGCFWDLGAGGDFYWVFFLFFLFFYFNNYIKWY